MCGATDPGAPFQQEGRTRSAPSAAESRFAGRGDGKAPDAELCSQRAVQTYLWALPAVTVHAMKAGLGRISGTGYDVQ